MPKFEVPKDGTIQLNALNSLLAEMGIKAVAHKVGDEIVMIPVDKFDAEAGRNIGLQRQLQDLMATLKEQGLDLSHMTHMAPGELKKVIVGWANEQGTARLNPALANLVKLYKDGKPEAKQVWENLIAESGYKPASVEPPPGAGPRPPEVDVNKIREQVMASLHLKPEDLEDSVSLQAVVDSQVGWVVERANMMQTMQSLQDMLKPEKLTKLVDDRQRFSRDQESWNAAQGKIRERLGKNPNFTPEDIEGAESYVLALHEKVGLPYEKCVERLFSFGTGLIQGANDIPKPILDAHDAELRNSFARPGNEPGRETEPAPTDYQAPESPDFSKMSPREAREASEQRMADRSAMLTGGVSHEE